MKRVADFARSPEVGGARAGLKCKVNVSIGGGLAVGVVAVGVRLAAAWGTGEVATARFAVGDAAGYLAWAERIAAGDPEGGEGFYQTPLYPHFLAAVMLVTGDSHWHFVAAQALLGGLGAWWMAWAAGRLFGGAAGVVAGLMLATYPPAVLAGIVIQKSALDVPLTCGLLALLAGGGGARGFGAWRGAALGAACGLLALNRENALLWVPLCGTYVWWMNRRRGARAAVGVAGLAAGCLAVLGPVAAWNARAGGSWSVTTFQSGPNFYIGNGAEADGRYRPLVRGHETPAFERGDARRLAEEAEGRALSAREVSAHWWRRAWGEIAADPWRWARLMGYKLLLAVNRYEVADAESLYVYAAHALPWGYVTLIWHFGLLAPLAAGGIVATWGRRGELWIYYLLAVVMIAAVAVFFVLGRYRLAAAVALMPPAAAGVVALRRGNGEVRHGE